MAQRLVPGLPPARFGIAGFDRASLLFAHGPDARFLAEPPGQLVAVADQEDRGLHRRGARPAGPQGARILVFDYLRSGFAAVLFFRAGPPGDG